MELIQINEKEKWNYIVKSFPKWDVYYLNEYSQSLQIHGDGVPRLVYHEDNQARLCYVMMQNDIADFEPLMPYLEKGKYYDWTTPYGYGGPLVEGKVTIGWIIEFKKELEDYCKKNRIITQFFRFHPLLQNQKVIEKVCDVIYMKNTVYIDTSDKETIFKNMTPNNRNMVRKAIKNGIEIIKDNGERLDDFISIYEATMRRNGAEDYYFFERKYFDYLIQELKENIIFFYAMSGNKPISAAIFFYNDRYMHYHLSGTLPEYRNLAATNLLLSSAAQWAAEQGIEVMHLGGGVGTVDSLLEFKKHFNRNGLIDFCIGRNIFDKQVFDELVGVRKKNDILFDETKPFLIKYRG